MVITAWSEDQRGSLLLPEHFWVAAVEWAKKERMVKALHLDCNRVGVDLYLDEGEDPDQVRHVKASELSAFLRDFIPPHKNCGPEGDCAACWREDIKERRLARSRGA